MATLVQMPKLTDTMEEGVIVKWHIKVGDAVEPGQQVAEVETDKAVMGMEAYDRGTVLHIIAEEGKAVPLGANIYVVGEEGENIPEEALKSGGGKTPDKSKEDKGKKEKAKDTGEPPEEKSGKKKEEPSPKEEEPHPWEKAADKKRIKVSPLAARMAADEGIDLQTLTGSGPGGRIVQRDIEAALEKRQTKKAPTERKSEVQPFTMLRKTVAKRMAQAWTGVPHFYLEREVDATALRRLQRDLKAKMPEAHISINDILIKCCAHALKKEPQCNASYTDEGIQLHGAIHISVAVALEEGLITPVVRHADEKTLLEVAEEVRGLAERARQRKLQPEEYTGGTFSISNLGMFGIDKFNAILNPPEALILAVGRVMEKPVVEDGAVVVRDRLWLTLSCDHRVVDGAMGAKFLDALAGAVEHPLWMLVG